MPIPPFTGAGRPTPNPPRLLLLGTGFAGFSLLKRLNLRAFDVTVVSSRNHFLFTPLLPGASVGTVELRSILEPVRRACRGVRFHCASARGLDPLRKAVRFETAQDGESFELAYDLLVVAVGAKVNTFGIPGVAENALFLKTVEDARRIRQRTLGCFERASMPGLSAEERRHLLHFMVVGGGPTGVEFAAELHDLVMREIRAAYPSLMDDVSITLVDAGDHILGSFDRTLGDYTARHFQRERIQVRTGVRVVRLERGRAVLGDGSQAPFGMVVWSTGLGPTIAADRFDLPKDRHSRIRVDGFLRVLNHDGLFAMGDCACVEGKNYPATAQVAMQQGAYLARVLNRRSRGKAARPFKYNHHGMLAYIGNDAAVADLAPLKGRGRSAYLFWRSAYLTRLVSWKNKALVLFDWLKAGLFGRDISRF